MVFVNPSLNPSRYEVATADTTTYNITSIVATQVLTRRTARFRTKLRVCCHVYMCSDGHERRVAPTTFSFPILLLLQNNMDFAFLFELQHGM
jgi:hypothetical protein